MRDFNKFKEQQFALNQSYEPWNDMFLIGADEVQCNGWGEFFQYMRLHPMLLQDLTHRSPLIGLADGNLKYSGLQALENYLMDGLQPCTMYVFDIKDNTAETKLQIELNDKWNTVVVNDSTVTGNTFYYSTASHSTQYAGSIKANESFYVTCDADDYKNGKLYVALALDNNTKLFSKYGIQEPGDLFVVRPLSNVNVNEHKITYVVNVKTTPAILQVYAKNGNVTQCSLDAQKFVDASDGLVTYKQVYNTAGAYSIDIWTTDETEELVVKNALNCSLGTRTVIW